jgi:hypothetical protein
MVLILLLLLLTVKAADEKTTISLDKDSVEIVAEATDTGNNL